MSTARMIVQEIIGAGGELWTDGNRVRGRNIPRRLAEQVKANEDDVLELLTSAPAPASPPADYDTAEREAIQWESELPPLEPLPDVPGFEDMPPLTAAQHGVIVRQCMGVTTQPTSVQPAPAMARQSLSERVSCGECVRFQPGPQPLAIGRCLASADGLPPSPKQGDYKAAFPMAKRHCCEFRGN